MDTQNHLDRIIMQLINLAGQRRTLTSSEFDNRTLTLSDSETDEVMRRLEEQHIRVTEDDIIPILEESLHENTEETDETQGTDIIRYYLKDIRRYSLLTRDEEIALAQRMEAGDAAARNRFICSNTRFAVNLAKKYLDKKVLSLPDLVEAANEGLLDAVKKYDYRKGRFVNYAARSIIKSIKKAIAEDMILGEKDRFAAFDRYDKMLRIEGELTKELERKPTTDEIALRMGEKNDEKVKEALFRAQRPAELDKPIDEETDSTMLELTEDREAKNPIDILTEKEAKKEDRAHLDQAYLCLDETELLVIKGRYGVLSEEDEPRLKTYRELSQELHVSAEWVRRIEKRALHKMLLSIKKGC